MVGLGYYEGRECYEIEDYQDLTTSIEVILEKYEIYVKDLRIKIYNIEDLSKFDKFRTDINYIEGFYSTFENVLCILEREKILYSRQDTDQLWSNEEKNL